MITFAKSRDYEMPFGKHRGKTLDKIAETDEGLLYLDWLSGEVAGGTTKDALTAYLSDKTIEADVQKLVRK